MSSVVCTLFEGTHHLGLAALVNSLVSHNYRGKIYAGYRGQLPPWAIGKIQKNNISDLNIEEYIVGNDISLCFIKLETDHHLTNYKPEFIYKICQTDSGNSDNIFYFDPDITINFKWEFYEKWATDSIAICEDVNPSIRHNHPKRKGWRQYFEKHNIDLPIDLDFYVNAGFMGFPRDASSFLLAWCEILQMMEKEDINLSSFSAGNHDLFSFPDQDALNVVLMREHYPLCVAGQEAMAFKNGLHYMFHAVGNPKPWNKPYLWYALNGFPPSLADKAYWKNTEYPIILYSKAALFMNRLRLNIAAGIGRFIRRS